MVRDQASTEDVVKLSSAALQAYLGQKQRDAQGRCRVETAIVLCPKAQVA